MLKEIKLISIRQFISEDTAFIIIPSGFSTPIKTYFVVTHNAYGDIEILGSFTKEQIETHLKIEL